MLTLQRLLRSRPELNSVMAHIFWNMMDEHMHVLCHLVVMCSNGSNKLFIKCFYIILESWI